MRIDWVPVFTGIFTIALFVGALFAIWLQS